MYLSRSIKVLKYRGEKTRKYFIPWGETTFAVLGDVRARDFESRDDKADDQYTIFESSFKDNNLSYRRVYSCGHR